MPNPTVCDWTPVAQALPEKGVFVLVALVDKSVNSATRLSSLPKGWRTSTTKYLDPKLVTHWAPMPEPPK